MKKTNKYYLRFAAFFLIIFIGISISYFKRVYQPWGTCDTDFTVYVRAAESLSKGEDIYSQSYLETGRDYYKYSPLFAVMMVPLSRLHMHLSVPLWFAGIFFCFMGAVFLIKKILETEDGQKPLSLAFFFFTLLMSLRFLLSVVQRVQSDCLVLLLLALFIIALYYRKDFFAGLSLALAIMVKLTPLIFLPYLLLRKRMKALGWSLAGIVFYLWLPTLYVGGPRNIAYIQNWFAVHKTNPGDYLSWYKNQSLLSLIQRLFANNSDVALVQLNPQAVILLFLVLAGILFGLIFLVRKNRSTQEPALYYLTDISLILICMVLFSPLAWKHTFVHLTIAHMAALYYVLYKNPADKLTRALVLISFFLSTILNPEMTRAFSQLLQKYSNVTWGTLALYAALLRIEYLNAHSDRHSHV